MFFIGVPASLKTGNGPVRAVELASLQSHHPRLTPGEGEAPNEEASEHHPRLATCQENEQKKTRPLLEGVEVRPGQNHQAACAGAEHEAGHGGDEHVPPGADHVMDADQDPVASEAQYHREKNGQGHRARSGFAQGK